MMLQQIEVGHSAHSINIEVPKDLETSQILSSLPTKSNITQLPKLKSFLSIYQITRQSDLEKRVDNALADKCDKKIDDHEWAGESIDWDNAMDIVVDEAKEAVDDFIRSYDLIDVCSEDDLPKWQTQKLLILNYLKKL